MTYCLKNSILLLITLSLKLSAADYYVATDGDDENEGTALSSPFATIQHAVQQMEAGDRVFMRGGSYHETIDLGGKAGVEGKPLTLTSYEGEKVILNGTVKITGEWELDEGKVYKIKIPQDITQLFVEGKLMTLARFPNAQAFSEKVWHRTAARCQKTRESTNGHVIGGKAPERDLSQIKGSLNNCVALLNFGAHSTSARLVQNHTKGSSEFDYSPELMKYKTTLNFFFEGGLGNAERVLLDSAGEWAYDETTKTLYLWADDGQNPTGRSINGKVQTYALKGDAKTKHIVVDGLNFAATAFSFRHSDHISIQNCNFDYYACSKRALGMGGFSDTAEFIGSVQDFCSDITLYNCAFRYSDASGLKGDCVENMRIENNLFYNIDYAGVNNDRGKGEPFTPCSSIRLNKIQGLVYRRNTLDTAGNAQGFSANRYIKNPNQVFRAHKYDHSEIFPIICEYNFHTKCGLQHTDGSSLYIPDDHVMESVTRYNWFIGNGQRDFRWDGKNKPLLGVHANLYRNVSFGTNNKKYSPSGGNGLRIKGSYHEVYNNTGIGRGGEINIATEKGGNEQTVTRNNAATNLTDYPIPGESSHNYSQGRKGANFKEMLRDWANWDFRPRADAEQLIDKGTPVKSTSKGKIYDVTSGYKGKAPDLGAYEYGEDVYWIPGRQESQASMPIPKNKGVNVKIDADLMYLIGLGGVKADLYLGTSADDLQLIRSKEHPKNIVMLSKEQALQKNTTKIIKNENHNYFTVSYLSSGYGSGS